MRFPFRPAAALIAAFFALLGLPAAAQDLPQLTGRVVDQADLLTPEQEAQHMMEHNHTGAWMQEIRRNKALALIVAQATVTDPDGNTIDVSGAPETADEE